MAPTTFVGSANGYPKTQAWTWQSILRQSYQPWADEQSLAGYVTEGGVHRRTVLTGWEGGKRRGEGVEAAGVDNKHEVLRADKRTGNSTGVLHCSTSTSVAGKYLIPSTG